MKEEIEEMPIENCLEEYCCKWEQRNREIAGKRKRVKGVFFIYYS